MIYCPTNHLVGQLLVVKSKRTFSMKRGKKIRKLSFAFTEIFFSIPNSSHLHSAKWWLLLDPPAYKTDILRTDHVLSLWMRICWKCSCGNSNSASPMEVQSASPCLLTPLARDGIHHREWERWKRSGISTSSITLGSTSCFFKFFYTSPVLRNRPYGALFAI